MKIKLIRAWKSSVLIILVIVLTLMLGACTTSKTPSPTSAPALPTSSSTEEPAAASTPTDTPEPTSTNKPSLTPTFTPTPTPQVFGRVFPDDYGQAGVAANHFDNNGYYHFDVGIPVDFLAEQDPILSPTSGRIVEHYLPGNGDAGECLTIEPDPPVQGIDEILISLEYDPDEVTFVYFHLCHIIPYKISGWIEVGEEIGVVYDRMTRLGQWSNIIAFVVRIGFEHNEIQVSPCLLPNNFDWCDICYPGAAQRNPCP